MSKVAKSHLEKGWQAIDHSQAKFKSILSPQT